jgi:hypothetical protein
MACSARFVQVCLSQTFGYGSSRWVTLWCEKGRTIREAPLSQRHMLAKIAPGGRSGEQHPLRSIHENCEHLFGSKIQLNAMGASRSKAQYESGDDFKTSR